MIPCSYITVNEGTWHSFRLSTKLLLLLTMMMMMMKSPYTSATIEMEILPREGFTFEEHEAINISCRSNLSNPDSFVLIRNGTKIVHMEYDKISNYFKAIKDTNNFQCYAYKQANFFEFSCTKMNLTCDDATSYICSVNNTYDSSPKTIPAKSS
uniref:Immunoglobulin subtype domain-containing protein n=1 Tax=Octopus bimaculoides TaxID=37653 RepID=A0A0L8G5R9_OCTBM